MRKIFVVILVILFVLAIFSPVFAQQEYHTFGRNPMVPGGLRQPAPGTVFIRTPKDFPQIRMWGASGESSVKILPAGTLVEARIVQNMFVAQRVVCCGNRITPVKWPITQIQGQKQAQQIIVQVNANFIQPVPKPDLALHMNSKMQGANQGEARYVNVGNVSKSTVTWSDGVYINNRNGNFDNQQQQDGGDQNIGIEIKK